MAIKRHEPEARGKEKKNAPYNVKPKMKCVCGKGLGYMQDKCKNCSSKEK